MNFSINDLMNKYLQGKLIVQNIRTEISLDTLYECIGEGYSIFIKPISSSVDIYVSNEDTQPTSKSDMILDTDSDEDIKGYKTLDKIPKWIYIEQNTGTSTSIVIQGLSLVSKGGFS